MLNNVIITKWPLAEKRFPTPGLRGPKFNCILRFLLTFTYMHFAIAIGYMKT